MGSNIHIVGGTNVRGNNGTVKGFHHGIQVVGDPGGHPVERIHLSGLTLTKNCVGLVLTNSNANQVSGSKILANEDGVELLNSNHNVFDSNVINNNDENGIFLAGSNDNTITSNKFSHNRSFGVRVGTPESDASNHNTIRDNTLKDSPDWGIRVDNGSSNTIQGNTLSGNDFGIQLIVGASRNFVYGNKARENQRVDLVDDNADCNDNIWTNNKFDTSQSGPATSPTRPSPCIR